MKVKRFEAHTMQRALEKVREEFGINALILSTRKVQKKPGHGSLFEEQTVEVTAGIEYDSISVLQNIKKEERLDNANTTEAYGEGVDTFFAKGQLSDNSSTENKDNNELEELMKEMKSIKEQLKCFEHRQRPREEVNRFPLSLPEAVANSYRFLRSNGVTDKTVVRIVNKLQKVLKEGKQDFPNMENLLPIISEEVKVSGPIATGESCPKIVALIGPTGVGKTTTVAKLAAYYSLTKKKKVAIFTLDTYRIAAVEQLKVYSRIMGVPLEIIEGPEDLTAKIAQHQDKNLILIDSSGRSQKNEEELNVLKKLLKVSNDIETHLVLSATTGSETLNDIVERFSLNIVIRSLIFTKLDEGFIFGNILNIASTHKIPISYLTVGQEVPQDIEVATARRISWLVLYPSQEI